MDVDEDDEEEIRNDGTGHYSMARGVRSSNTIEIGTMLDAHSGDPALSVRDLQYSLAFSLNN
jgi:hypothetical protein